MAINVNPLSAPALASLAGSQFPDLRLDYGAYDPSGYGKALFQGALAEAQLAQQKYNTDTQAQVSMYSDQQSNARNEANNINNIQKQLLADQNAGARTLFQGQIQMRNQDMQSADKQAELGLKNQQFQQQFGLDSKRADLYAQQVAGQNANIDLQRQKLIQEMAQKDLDMKMKMDQAGLDKRYAAAATYITALNGLSPSDPNYQAKSDKILDVLHSNGALDTEHYDALSKLDPQSRQVLITRDMMGTQAARQGKLMVTAQNNIPQADKALTSKAMQDKYAFSNLQDSLNNSLGKFNPVFMSYKAQLKEAGDDKFRKAGILQAMEQDPAIKEFMVSLPRTTVSLFGTLGTGGRNRAVIESVKDMMPNEHDDAQTAMTKMQALQTYVNDRVKSADKVLNPTNDNGDPKYSFKGQPISQQQLMAIYTKQYQKDPSIRNVTYGDFIKHFETPAQSSQNNQIPGLAVMGSGQNNSSAPAPIDQDSQEPEQDQTGY